MLGDFNCESGSEEYSVLTKAIGPEVVSLAGGDPGSTTCSWAARSPAFPAPDPDPLLLETAVATPAPPGGL